MRFLSTILAVLLIAISGPEGAKAANTGVHRVTDINPGTGWSVPNGFAEFAGMVYFGAHDGISGHELWRTDGTAAGTSLVKDINPSSGSTPRELTPVGDVLLFTAWTAGDAELWRSDGTSAGTTLVKDTNPFGNDGPRELTMSGGTLFFSAIGFDGDELWKSDGTAAGTLQVKNIAPGSIGFPNSNPSELTDVGGTLFLAAANGVFGRELWKSDGTEAGTTLVKNVHPLGDSGPHELTEVGDTLFFVANDGIHGRELWKSDGTEGGTTLVKDIVPGSAASRPLELANIGGTLYFVADDGVHGRELWKSDGTEAGTTLVADINPGPDRSFNHPRDELTEVGGNLFFVADDGVHGNELWKSDGTTVGTVLVKDINPGSGGSTGTTSTDDLTAAGDQLFFAAANGRDGRELWTSDGTEAGTVLVKDINVGPESAEPAFLAVIGDTLYLGALDKSKGHELWKVEIGP